jgi:ketosteroid isomerase-like protein
MRILAGVLLLALVLSTGPMGSASAHPPSILSDEAEKATAEEVKDFRKTVSRAIEKKDAGALRKLYAKGFTHADETGKVVGADARIAAALAGEQMIENAPAADLAIRVPGGWTAIATGTSQIRAGDGKTRRVRWMAVYVRMGEGWQIAASQATPLGEAK